MNLSWLTRHSILALSLLMAGIVLGVSFLSSLQSRQTLLATHQAHLISLARAQAELIKSVGAFDRKYSQTDHPQGALGATLTQVQKATANFRGQYRTSDIVIAQLQGGDMLFHALKGLDLSLEDRKNLRVRFDDPAHRGEPMRLALRGKKGVTISPDYRGVTVVAAYEYIPELNLGLVAKVDLAEVEEAFWKGVILQNLITLVLVFLGSWGFLTVLNPLFVQLSQENQGRKEGEQALQQEQRRLERAQQIARIGGWEWDNQRHRFYFSTALQTILGLPKDSHPDYETFVDFIHEEDRPRFIAAMDQALEQRQTLQIEYRILTGYSETLFVHSLAEVITDAAGKVLRLEGVMRDITQEKLAHQRLQLLAKVFEKSMEAVVITDERNQIVEVNPSFERITGFGFSEVLGYNPKRLSSGRHSPEFYKAMWRQIEATNHWEGEIWDRRKGGSIYPKHLSITRFINEVTGKTNYLGVFSDITEQKNTEKKLELLAYFDPLTGLSNRSFFLEELSREVKFCQRSKAKMAVLFMDLDHFKHVNDSLGHKAGDQLLVDVASRVRTSLRESDLVGRLGGDEFVIMLKNLRHNDDVVIVCQELLKRITSPFQLEGQEIYINTSIGIALYPEDGASANDLIKNADAAMYLSKERGKGTFSFYTEELDQRAKRRIFLDSSLHQAILQNQFHLLFQPQVDGLTNEVLGAEALIRWHHPTQGVISPIDFIPVAEETGLILPIGDWVLQEACRLNKLWQDQGLRPVVISINVSQKQFAAGNLVAKVDQALQASGLDPRYLKLEITESLLMQQVDHTIKELQTLRRMGIHSSIDDFGTGYSSLSYLKQFPISDLKIDQAFTRDILQDARIAQAIISLAKSLGLRVVAEGVETQDQVNFLVEKGCQVMQGYFYAKPLEAAEFAKLLAQPASPQPKKS